ncbi:MAG: phosphotransferase [Candidatus Thorarchaeota archaeon]
MALTMMTYPIKTVHGHSHSELEAILEDSCTAFDDFINLEQINMGGWSNINLRGKSSDFDFVLKLPGTIGPFTENPYDQLYDIALYFSKIDLTARPIEVGRLSDSAKTPFYIIEYIEGISHSVVSDVSVDELLSLKETIRIFRDQKPPNLPTYKSPTDYLLANHEPVENHVWLSKASKETQILLNKYDSLFHQVKDQTDTLDNWSKTLMHGDMWIPNVIFRSNQNALLLDFEACSYGDPRYDLASLLEVHVNSSIESIPSLILEEDIETIKSLRPLVLSYVIDWCLDRLLLMESGIMEPNLSREKLHTMIIGYAQEKIDRLKFLLH